MKLELFWSKPPKGCEGTNLLTSRGHFLIAQVWRGPASHLWHFGLRADTATSGRFHSCLAAQNAIHRLLGLPPIKPT